MRNANNSNDVTIPGTCFSMFVYIHALFRFALIGGNLTAQSTGSHRGIGVGVQIADVVASSWLSKLFFRAEVKMTLGLVHASYSLPYMHIFLCLFVAHSFIHYLTHSFVYSVLNSLFIPSFIRWFVCLFIHSLVRSFFHSFIRFFVRSFIHSLTNS